LILAINFVPVFATCCIQPLDMIKTRLQLAGEGSKTGGSFLTVTKNFIRTGVRSIFSNLSDSSIVTLFFFVSGDEGFFAMYRGLSAGLLRQATYTTARMGLFRTISDAIQEPGKTIPFYQKVLAGASAGGMAAVFGVPADLILIRLQADQTLPVEQRRNYTGLGNAFSRIVRDEGFGALFKGAAPTVVRAMFLNVGMLAFNDEILDQLKARQITGQSASLGAAAVSGFLASFFSLPCDFVKTRMQKQKADAAGKLQYSSSMDCVFKVLKNEGVTSFWRGFPTFYVRIAPHVMITLLAVDAVGKNLATRGW
jgi:solute carrier family 25 oxoglutarate transporter 11